MLLKSADDKSKRVALLEELQRSQLIDQRQRKWLRDELLMLQKGIRGEQDSAHYLDNYFKDGENSVLLHDLRFVVDGDVAQIDHLILNRASKIYLLETKNYACNLVINEQGEFTAEYERDRFGIQSPIEQSRRHERVLCKLLERLDIVGRTQKLPDFHHVVLLHPKATIERPPAKVFDTSNVIKADQFPTWHKQFVDSLGVATVFKSALNMRGLDTIKEWGEKLMRQHRPAGLLSLPDFMRPKEPRERAPAASNPVSGTTPSNTPLKGAAGRQPQSAMSTPSKDEPQRRLICAKCAAKISFAEGKFCWNNAARFGGVAYCREHQAQF
jgi:Nuclease-related domain